MMNNNKTSQDSYHFPAPDTSQSAVKPESEIRYKRAEYFTRNRYLKIHFVYFIFSILFLSCYRGDKVPPKVIKPEEMGNIMWDIMRAQSLASQIALKDSTVDVAIKTKLLSQKVFEIHKIDSTKFNKSYNWYIRHPDLLKNIFDSIYSRKQKENNLELKKNQIHHRPK